MEWFDATKVHRMTEKKLDVVGEINGSKEIFDFLAAAATLLKLRNLPALIIHHPNIPDLRIELVNKDNEV